MPVYEDYVRDRHGEANEARGDAEARLIDHLNEGDSIVANMAEVARAQAVAAWWNIAVTAMDQEGLDPVDALARTRKDACQILTDRSIRQEACPFAQGFVLARIEAARTFYHATGHLNEITARRAS